MTIRCAGLQGALSGVSQCKRSSCKNLLFFNSFPSWLWLFGARKDGTALLWRASVLLCWISLHCTWKVRPPVTAASLCSIFTAISFCLIHSMDPRWLNSQNPALLDSHNQNHSRKPNFLCAQRGGCWSSPKTSTGRVSPALFPLSLPFPRSSVNLIIPYIIGMQIKTEHTFSCTHGLTSVKKKKLRSIY